MGGRSPRPVREAPRFLRALPVIAGVMEGDNLGKAFSNAADKAKLNTTEEERKLRFHDLHRTYARVLLGGGCDIACVAQQLGHSPAVLLSTYTGVINASSGTEKGQPE